jgi:hypothetical protein
LAQRDYARIGFHRVFKKPSDLIWSFAAMATEKGHFQKATVLLDPDVYETFVEWAKEDRRPVGNLLRYVLSGIADERMAAREQRAA